MRRFLSLLLAGALSSGAFAVLFAAAAAAGPASPQIVPMKTIPAYGPHLMLPDPDAYPTVPFTQPAGWTGTAPAGTRAGGPRTRGIQPVLVLLVDFTDVAGQASSESTIRTLTSDTSPGARSVANYYSEVSYGLFGIRATTTVWYHSGHTMAYYGKDSASGYDDANGPISRLVVDAVNAAAADSSRTWRFSDFDADNDTVVDHLIVVHAGNGEESDTSNTNLIWSHRWSVIDANPGVPGDQPLTADGVQIYGYSMDAEFSPVGVFCHELGHDLGLPDLYDTDLSSLGIGVWDVMSTGSWNGVPRGTDPAELSAWSKIKLGWVAPTVVTTALLGQSIPEVETNATVFKMPITSSTSGDEYFLVENREKVGFDAGLPGGGLLIWHVDDSMPGNTVDTHRLVGLEEADGNDRPDQATDPWSNTATGWGPDTTPNSNSYLNERTGWKVKNISPSGPVMTADLSREVDDDLALVGVRVGAHDDCCVPTGTTRQVTVTVANRGARAQQDFVVNLTMYRGTVAPANVVCCNGQTVPSLVQGASANLTWDVRPPSAGKYVLDAYVTLAGDEIPENNRLFAHFVAGTFYFFDDVESGNAGWATNGGGTDPARWSIVQDANASESRSPTHAWWFGPQPGVCVLCPDFHTLTTPVVNVTSGPVYLYFWTRYDLRGKGIDNNTGTPATDTAYVNVTVNGGTPFTVQVFQGRALDWEPLHDLDAAQKPITVDLSSRISGPSSISVTLSASSKVLLRSGGWWVDDVALSSAPLSPGIAAVAVTPTVAADPGTTAEVRFAVANVGDFDDNVTFALQPPAGWIAGIGENESGIEPYAAYVARLRPDAGANLILAFQVGADAVRGSRYTVPVTATSGDNVTLSATFDAVVTISDPFGLAGLERYVFVFLIVLAAVIVIAVIIDAFKKQRGTYRRW